MERDLAAKLKWIPFKLPDFEELERRLVEQAKTIVLPTIFLNIETGSRACSLFPFRR
jgi:hypothetical protein